MQLSKGLVGSHPRFLFETEGCRLNVFASHNLFPVLSSKGHCLPLISTIQDYNEEGLRTLRSIKVMILNI
jgi:hypothetical protein